MKYILLILLMAAGSITAAAQKLIFTVQPVKHCYTYDMASLNVLDYAGDTVILLKSKYSTTHNYTIDTVVKMSVDAFKKIITPSNKTTLNEALQVVDLVAVKREK